MLAATTATIPAPGQRDRPIGEPGGAHECDADREDDGDARGDPPARPMPARR
jgi:hypothetical protein